MTSGLIIGKQKARIAIEGYTKMLQLANPRAELSISGKVWRGPTSAHQHALCSPVMCFTLQPLLSGDM